MALAGERSGVRRAGPEVEKKTLLILSEEEVNELRMLVLDRDEQAALAYLKEVVLKKVELALRKSCRK